MNRLQLLSGVALFGAMVVIGHGVLAETTEKTTTTTTNASGTVSSFSPGTIIIKSETASSPTSYSSTKTTTYVDDNGNPVSVETVKSGAPVTVYYTQSADGLVASKVVVKKSVSGDPANPTTTTEEKRTTVTP